MNASHTVTTGNLYVIRVLVCILLAIFASLHPFHFKRQLIQKSLFKKHVEKQELYA